MPWTPGARPDRCAAPRGAFTLARQPARLRWEEALKPGYPEEDVAAPPLRVVDDAPLMAGGRLLVPPVTTGGAPAWQMP